MQSLRVTLHILLAGLYVFLSALTVMAEWGGDGTIVGIVVLILVAAWAGASSMVRTLPSLIAAGAGIGALGLLSFAGDVFNHYLGLFVLVVLVPLGLSLLAVVTWRASAERNQGSGPALSA